MIRRDIDRHWTYFSVRDDRDNGTAIDFLQRHHARSLGAVRRELRPWLSEGTASIPRSALSLDREKSGSRRGAGNAGDSGKVINISYLD